MSVRDSSSGRPNNELAGILVVSQKGTDQADRYAGQALVRAVLECIVGYRRCTLVYDSAHNQIRVAAHHRGFVHVERVRERRHDEDGIDPAELIGALCEIDDRIELRQNRLDHGREVESHVRNEHRVHATLVAFNDELSPGFPKIRIRQPMWDRDGQSSFQRLVRRSAVGGREAGSIKAHRPYPGFAEILALGLAFPERLEAGAA